MRAPAVEHTDPDWTDPDWVGTWAAAASGGISTDGYAGHTIRNLVHTSVGGDRVRVKLSNAFGTEPVLVEHTTVGLQRERGSAAVAEGTLRDATFDGALAVTLPAGAEVYSDPIELRLGAAADLFVTTFTPEPSGPVTYHQKGLATSYVATDGHDHAASTDGSALTGTTTSWHYVTEVDVEQGASPGAVVALGDSITDGSGSRTDLNLRYPDVLAARLRAAGGEHAQVGVLNAGIGGTITPFKGWESYSPEQEATRQAVNDWIRTTDAFDVVVDFDATVRDPEDPQRLLPAYDSGDHLHPGEAGLAAMAGAVDLSSLLGD